MLTAALRLRGLTIDEATGGSDAVKLLRVNNYAVVLLDILMPEGDGFGVLEALDGQPHPPVVLVVSGADRSVLERLDTKRVHGIVRKPFDSLEVANVVADCADIRSRSAFETMALATMMSSAPLIALLKL